MSRLAPQPGERIDRSKTISFTFDGKPVTAFEGDTIGSALYAAGQRTFSRSFKYHRRRGLMCVAGRTREEAQAKYEAVQATISAMEARAFAIQFMGPEFDLPDHDGEGTVM